jgi:heptosyltransferase-2
MSDIARVVVRAPNWLGDAVMAIPAMAAVRRAFAGRPVVLAAAPAVAALFEEITPAAPDAIVSIDRARERDQLRAAQADGILLMPNSFGSAWIAARSGIAERWGYRAGGRGMLLTRGVRRPRRPIHQVQYYLELVRGLGIDAPDHRPQIQPRPATLVQADALLRSARAAAATPIVGFAPGAAYGHAKRWPPDRVAQVIAGLAQQGIAALLVGAGDDRATGRAIESSLPAGVPLINLIGRTTLRQLVGVIARCRAFVSNDSGAMHVAAAVGVPLTAIFGPTDERATRPAGDADVILRDVFCRPCMLRECPIDHRCMKRIDVDTVLHSVMAHLG